LKIVTKHERFTSGATVALALLLIFSTLSFHAWGVASPEAWTSSVSETDYPNLIKSLDMAEVGRHAEYLAGLGTRATGYPGNDLAAQYVYNEFVKYGLVNVTFYEFPVVDCIDHGANITVAGQVIRIYPLRPNLVCPSTTTPEGLTGRLIYAGQGHLEDFDGSEVNGSIVLMDWYTKDRWINAAKFGAKAVIFIPPIQILSSQWELTAGAAAGLKYLADVPLNFPRFYVERAGALTLKQHLGENVRILSNQTWEQLTGRNVMGFLPGTDYDKIVVLSSYYDSCSVAPSFAPGAQEALGVAGLLELAKYLSNNRPKLSVLFIAFGCHHQALTGATMFVNDYLGPLRKDSGLPYTGSGDAFGKRFVVQLNLDLSTGSNAIFFTAKSMVWGAQYGIYPATWLYMGYAREKTGYLWTKVYVPVNSWRRSYDGKTYQVMFSGVPVYAGPGFAEQETPIAMPWKEFAYDHEPHVPMITGGYTFTTASDSRPLYAEPFDTLDRIGDEGWRNLQTQLEFIRISIVSLLNEKMTDGKFEDGDLSKMMAGFKDPREKRDYAGEAQNQAWTKITGYVATYKKEIAGYETWNATREGAKALVYLEASGWGITQGAWMRRFNFTDNSGKFELLGASCFYGHLWFISPWVVNSTTGNVIYAPDHGRRAWGTYGIMPLPGATGTPTHNIYDLGYSVMFKASTIALFDIYLSTYLTLQEALGVVQPPSISVRDFSFHLEPESLSKWQYGATALVLAVPPNLALEIIWKFPTERYPHGLLLNPAPAFSGYKLETGEQLILPLTNLRYAETFRLLNEEHLSVVGRYVPNPQSTEPYQMHLTAGELIEDAWKALDNNEYSKAYSYAALAWRDCQIVYSYARSWIEDSASTINFFAALLIPFVFLAEKLLFGWQGFKRLASFLGLFAFLVVAFYLLHPGFTLASSPVMIIIGFCTLALSIPLLVIVFRYSGAFIKAIRLERIGKHEAEISRVSEVGHAFFTGVEHMRKMRLRTILTLVSIILMVAALCNLTSISAIHVTQPSLYEDVIPPKKPLYEGIYMHKYKWGFGAYAIPEELVSLLESKYGANTPYKAKIAPRAWRYTLYKTPGMGPGQDYETDYWRGRSSGFKVYYNGKNITVPILWGLTPEEWDLGWPELYLCLPGEWFKPGIRSTIILNDDQALALGINATETIEKGIFPKVTFEGATYTVINILEGAGPIRDLDMEQADKFETPGFTPIMTYEKPLPTWEKHVELKDCLIMHYEDVIALGGTVASVSIKPADPGDIPTVAKEVFSLLSDYQIYFAVEQKIQIYTRGLELTIWGLQYQIIPMAVVALALFNIMLGTVHERRREIGTYGTVGLSPLHIAFMFLAESAVYALVGGIIGYLFAFLQGKIFGAVVPGIMLNYSSSWAVISVGIAMAATLISSIYPITLASRLVTPSLERAWKVPTKPKGDVWEVPLPFYASGTDEAGGIIAFLREYVEPHLLKDAPEFSVANIKTAKGEMEGRPFIEVSMDMRLFPYEMGVAHKSSVYMLQIEPTRWESRVVLRRTGGAVRDWERLSRNFMDLLRKQLLLWRTMSPTEKTRYTESFRAGGGS